MDTGSYTYFDYDNDGDLDIAALPQTGPLLFYRNNSSLNSIAFELRDSVSNSHGIGSKITIRYGGNEKLAQYREIQAGGGFISYDAPRAYFGLGEFDTIDSIEIAWSDGAVSKIDGPIDSQQLLRIAR